MKKKKWCKFRHKVVTFIFRPVFMVLFFFKFNLKYKREKLPKEGALILCNHTMAFDPFIVGCKFNKPLYYMTSKDLFQNKFVGKLMTYLLNPIPKEKSNKGDMSSIKNCLTIAKENGTICIFPEGNRTFNGKLGNVDYSIVKLVKLLKKSLIIVNIKGGYSSDPRWSNKRRKNRIECYTRTILSYDDYKNLDNDVLYNLIIDNLTVDEYSLNVKFRGKKRAEYLESILYICPVCKKMHVITSVDNYVVCKECGLKVYYNEDLTLNSDNSNFNFKYIHEWYDYQVEFVKNMEVTDKVIYEDEIEVYEPKTGEKREFIGKGEMLLYKDYFKFKFLDKEMVLDYNDIYVVTLLGRMKMNIYYLDKAYQVFNDRRTNLLKYMHMFYILKNKREGVEDGFIGI